MEDITVKLKEQVTSSNEVVIPEGRYLITDTIDIPSNVKIIGTNGNTELHFGDAVNKNMFTNLDHSHGNSHITIEDIKIYGNWKKQFRPESQNKLSFCNAFYFSNVTKASFKKVEVSGFLQTALHFNNCDEVSVSGLNARDLGWSGISTSGTNNLFADDIYIYNSGCDHRHSAVHIDGGINIFLECSVVKCNGNGVMLDSTFSDFDHAIVSANCYECMRGIALIGSPKSTPNTILLKDCNVMNNEVGIMVSNSNNAFIVDSKIESNSEYGLLFQGRVGGNNNMVLSCRFKNNNIDVDEIHSSFGNVFHQNYLECDLDE